MSDAIDVEPEAEEPPKTSIQKTVEVIEQMASEAGGSPVAAFVIPLIRQRLPTDPEVLDEQLAKYAKLLLMMRSDGAPVQYTIDPNPFRQGEPNGATASLPAPVQG